MDTFSPAPQNCQSIGGMVCISLALVIGIVSIVFTAFANDPSNYYWKTDAYIASGLGGAGLVLAIVAYPLTSHSAKAFMRGRNSKGIKGLMISSWIFYGITIVSGIGLIGAGVAGGYVATIWVVCVFVWTVIGWSFMLAHAEKARRSPGDQTRVLAQQQQELQVSMPPKKPRYNPYATSSTSSATLPQQKEVPMPPGSVFVTIKEETSSENGKRVRTTTKRTTNPDGSILVEETEEVLEDV